MSDEILSIIYTFSKKFRDPETNLSFDTKNQNISAIVKEGNVNISLIVKGQKEEIYLDIARLLKNNVEQISGVSSVNVIINSDIESNKKNSSDDKKFKVLILVSDGEDNQGEAIAIAKEAAELGVIIHTLGIGTKAGAPIPIFDDNGIRKEFKKNLSGKVVTSTLNATLLNEVSTLTGGVFIRIENQVNAIMPVLQKLEEMEKRQIKSHVFSQYEDRYQMFLLIGLLLLIVEFIISTRTKEEMIWKGRFTTS